MMNLMQWISSSQLSENIVPGLEVVGKAHNVIDGVQLIKEIKPDLVFLDVEMPNGTGFDLLDSFP